MMTPICEPIDLIVANTMHRSVARVEAFRQSLESALRMSGEKRSLDAVITDQTARALLCDVAQLADMRHVYAALKAVGAPCSADDIEEGRTAIKERART